jgi:ABC-type multidrug transport system permease subunit
MRSMRRFFFALQVNATKDLRIWARRRAVILSALVMPLTYVLVVYLGAAAVGASPVALVVEDQGTAARQVTRALYDAGVFRISEVDAPTGLRLYSDLDVAAIITIPPGFSSAVEAHQAAHIIVQARNYNLDVTDDLRRAVPDAITVYYEQLPDSPLLVGVAEQDLREQDVEIFQFAVVPMITLLLLVHALIASGIAVAREWEDQSVKELLLAPVSQTAIILGKVFAGFLTTFALGLAMLGLGYALGWTRPQGIYLATALLAMALVSLFASGVGIAMGTWLRRVQTATSLSTTLSVWVFFGAGGIGVLQFEPDILKRVAAFDPLTYGTHAMQMAIFYGSADLLFRDLAVLAGVALAMIAVGSLAMRRGFAH